MKKTFIFMLLVCLAFAGSLFAKEANNVKPWEAEKIAPVKSNYSADAKLELPAQFRTRSQAYARANEYGDGFYVSFDTDTPGDMTEIVAPPTWPSYAGDFGQLDETMFYAQNSDTYELMSIDVATGDATTIGATGLDASLTDMAMNKQTGVMYATDGSNLYTIDLTTGAATMVGALNNNDGTMITLACDGTSLFGIDLATDDLWSIDASTGAATMIGATGFDCTYAQSMSWDPATETMFWASYGGGLDGKLRTVDLSTGSATIVADFEGGREVTILAFPGGGADANAPAQATNFSVTPDAAGALSVVIAWTNPDTNVDGGTLTELTDVKVYRDDTLIHTVSTPTMGNAETYTDTDVTASGLYSYKVVGTNTNGEGLPIAETVFVGNDVPAAVTNLTLAVNNTFEAVLTWTNPTTGLNGGYFDGTITGYTILRSDGTSTDVTGSVETWTETLTADQSGYYSYSVTPINAAGNGESAVSNTAWIGDTFSGILIIDLATDNNTGAALQTEISSLYSGTVVVADSITQYPITNDIDAIFISCGWYGNGGVKITPEQAPPIVDYINAGGNVYLEGGDTFGFDPGFGGYDFNSLFGIDSAVDGSADLSNVAGAGFLAGTNSAYTGINNYIDQLTINASAQEIFTNQDVGYTCGVAYDNTYKTVAASFQVTETENANAYINGILTFFGLGSPVGSLSGVITDSATTDPIEGATVTIGTMVRTTDATGAYSFSMLPAGDHEVVASMEFYTSQTVTVTITEDVNSTQDFALVHVPTGTLSGNVTAEGSALEGATITVNGMDATSDASGNYTITGINPGEYNVTCMKMGYLTATATATITGDQVTTQDFVLELLPNAAPVLVGTLEDNDVHLTWTIPNGNGAASFADDFEDDFAEWDEYIAGPGTPGAGGTSAWYVTTPDGDPYDGNCAKVDWGYTIDTWLITPAISIDANTTIDFDWYGSYTWSVDPNDNCDLFIKISTDDGATWTPVWTFGDIGVWENFTWYETSLQTEIADYVGQSVKIAFNLVGDDNGVTCMDNVSIGAGSRSEGTHKLMNSNYALNETKLVGTTLVQNTRNVRNSRNTRELEGFKVYRGTEMIADLASDVMSYDDMDLDYGTYEYKVVAEYDDEDLESNIVTIVFDPPVPDAPTGLTATFNDPDVDLEWTMPGEGAYEFRYDDGTATGQLGFGDNPASVLGGAHYYDAVINEVTWMLTSNAMHTEAMIYICGLQANGTPDDQNILHQSELVPNIDDAWNTYTLATPVEAPNGFFVGICTPNIFTALGTDDGVGAPYEFQSGTQWGIADITAGTNEWLDVGPAGFEVNFTVRALGANNGALARPAYVANENADYSQLVYSSNVNSTRNSRNFVATVASRELEGFKIYRDGTAIETIMDPAARTYTDLDPADGTHTYYVTAIYDGVESPASPTADVEVTDNEYVDTYATAYKGNFPNPFNPTTTVSFSIAKDADVKVVIYNVKGQVVKTLVNDTMTAGDHEVQWNGNDNKGKAVASGVYYVRMNAENYTKTSKMLLMK